MVEQDPGLSPEKTDELPRDISPSRIIAKVLQWLQEHLVEEVTYLPPSSSLSPTPEIRRQPLPSEGLQLGYDRRNPEDRLILEAAKIPLHIRRRSSNERAD